MARVCYIPLSVSERTEILGTPESVVEPGLAQNSFRLATLRQLFAALLSAAWPGAGHILLGQFPKGMLLSALFVGILSSYGPLRLLRYYAGFLTLIVSLLVLGLYSTCTIQLMRNPRTGHRASLWWFAFTLPTALIIISLTNLGVTRASGFRPFTVPSTSMEPTIQRDDRVMVDTRAYRVGQPQYRDVIVFYRDRTFLAKRIIGISGDTVEGRSERITVNGNLINESYIEHSEVQSVADQGASGYNWIHSFGPMTVPAGKFFVMGDNRDVSLDSRSPGYGFVDRGSIIGRVLYVYRSAKQGVRIR